LIKKYIYTQTENQLQFSDAIFTFQAQLSQNGKHRIVGYQRQQRIHLPSKNNQMKVSQKTGSETNIAFGHGMIPSNLIIEKCILPYIEGKKQNVTKLVCLNSQYSQNSRHKVPR